MSAQALIGAAQTLSAKLDGLKFSAPVTHVYNPLDYAGAAHTQYLSLWGGQPQPRRVIFLGMNPGPFGMVQVGVPFGEVAVVHDWLRINAPIRQPLHMNPKRPIEGWACTRSEVSGRRLWGLFQARFGTPEAFFAEHFVANYCPLAFFDSGRNITPDKLPAAEMAPVLTACDEHLRALVQVMQPDWVVGVGAYAQAQAERALADVVQKPQIGRVLHPSPASPAANRGWAEAATAQMIAQGIWPDLA
ncbi:MAG: uracil-DNA glycosylase family protein [Fluviibacter sp.]